MSHAARITAIIIIVIACLAVGSPTAQPISPLTERGLSVVSQSEWKEKSCRVTKDEGLAILYSIKGMYTASHNSVNATLYFTGGGDPAMNGCKPYLLIEEDDFRTGNSYLYDPELNVAQIDTFDYRGNSFILRVLEDAESREGDIVTYRIEYSFHFTLDREEHLNEKITIKRKVLGLEKD